MEGEPSQASRVRVFVCGFPQTDLEEEVGEHGEGGHQAKLLQRRDVGQRAHREGCLWLI